MVPIYRHPTCRSNPPLQVCLRFMHADMRRLYLNFGLIVLIPPLSIEHMAYDAIDDNPLHRIGRASLAV